MAPPAEVDTVSVPTATDTVSVSVADVLDMDEVRAGKPRVVAGSRNLNTMVRWVHVAEVPDIALLLKGGELVLTTGIALPDDEHGLTRYVLDLVHAGASGLAVELVRRYRELPRALVQAAERFNLPLIALEHETPFVAVTEAVHARILSTQFAELRTEDRVRRALQTMVARASVADLVRKMSELARCPIVFENLAHRPLAVAGYTTPVEELLAGWEARSRQLDADRPGWHSMTVEPRGQQCGRVIMLTDRLDGVLHRAVLATGAEALALAWLVAGPPSLEHAAQRELVDDIVSMRCRSIDEVYVRARALGVDLRRRPFAVLCIRSGHPLCTDGVVAQALERTGFSGLVGRPREDQVYVLVALSRPEDAIFRLDRLAEEIRRGFDGPAEALAFGATQLTTRIGLEELARAVYRADEAACSDLGSGEQRIVTGDDIELPGLLRLLADDARVQRFVTSELRRLWRFDELHGTNLLDVLTVYLESGGNKSVAAARSHLSRATLYNSLQRLGVILQRDLEDPEVRAALYIAILASRTSAGWHERRRSEADPDRRKTGSG